MHVCPSTSEHYFWLPQHIRYEQRVQGSSCSEHAQCNDRQQRVDGFNLNYESFRPSNLPPKNKRETEAHAREVQALEHQYRNRLQKRVASDALEQMKKAQRKVISQSLWLIALCSVFICFPASCRYSQSTVADSASSRARTQNGSRRTDRISH